jgi:hypothetical protein
VLKVDAECTAQAADNQSFYSGATAPGQNLDARSNFRRSVPFDWQLCQSFSIVVIPAGDDECQTQALKVAVYFLFVSPSLRPGPVEAEIAHVKACSNACPGRGPERGDGPAGISVPVAKYRDGLRWSHPSSIRTESYAQPFMTEPAALPVWEDHVPFIKSKFLATDVYRLAYEAVVPDSICSIMCMETLGESTFFEGTKSC